MNLHELLDVVTVTSVDMLAKEHREAFEGCGNFIVEDENSTRGVFWAEGDALFFRLAIINARLNSIGGVAP